MAMAAENRASRGTASGVVRMATFLAAVGNSTANNHNQTVSLTTGGSSYALTRTVFDRADRRAQTIADNTAESLTAYDGAGRAIQTTDALGNTINTKFDGNSNATLVTRTEYSTITAPATAPEVFQMATLYDCVDKPVATAMQDADGSFTTDLTQIAYSNQGSQPGSIFTLTGYDSRGNQTVSMDSRGNSGVKMMDVSERELPWHVANAGVWFNLQDNVGLFPGRFMVARGEQFRCNDVRAPGGWRLGKYVDRRTADILSARCRCDAPFSSATSLGIR